MKNVFTVDDIVRDFMTAAYLLSFGDRQIEETVKKIREEDFHLGFIIKCGRKRFICEWRENGITETDIWVIEPSKFVSSITQEYIREAKKIPE